MLEEATGHNNPKINLDNISFLFSVAKPSDDSLIDLLSDQPPLNMAALSKRQYLFF